VQQLALHLGGVGEIHLTGDRDGVNVTVTL
jgi:hypothetical protein